MKVEDGQRGRGKRSELGKWGKKGQCLGNMEETNLTQSKGMLREG